VCPTRYRTRHFFNNFTTNEAIATEFEADLPHCVRNVTTTNVLLFKFRCNIFIGVRIIKEKAGFGNEWDTLYVGRKYVGDIKVVWVYSQIRCLFWFFNLLCLNKK